jgi:hypothetical protein
LREPGSDFREVAEPSIHRFHGAGEGFAEAAVCIEQAAELPPVADDLVERFFKSPDAIGSQRMLWVFARAMASWLRFAATSTAIRSRAHSGFSPSLPVPSACICWKPSLARTSSAGVGAMSKGSSLFPVGSCGKREE